MDETEYSEATGSPERADAFMQNAASGWQQAWRSDILGPLHPDDLLRPPR
jgi:hypothetical protein